MSVVNRLYAARDYFYRKYGRPPTVAFLPPESYFSLGAETSSHVRQGTREGDSFAGMVIVVSSYYDDIKVGILE